MHGETLKLKTFHFVIYLPDHWHKEMVMFIQEACIANDTVQRN